MSVKFCITVVFIIIAGLVQLANCWVLDDKPPQADCDKYCYKDCSDYFNEPGNEFSRCVQANVYCSCGSNVSVVAWIGIAFGGIILIVCICCCKMRMQSSCDDITKSSNVEDATRVGPMATAIEMPVPLTFYSTGPALISSNILNQQERTQLGSDSDAPPPTYDQVLKQMPRNVNS